MRIQGIYLALTTANMAKAEEFYAKLFERAPDDRPMEGLVQWRGVAGANIQIFKDKGTAGSGRCTIVVPNMNDARNSPQQIGVNFTGEREGDFGRIAQNYRS
jgi:hypothetical protein